MDIDNNPELIKEVINAFAEDMLKVSIKEATEDDYLNQKDFASGKERAKAAVLIASERAINILALAIDKHREEEHGEDTKENQKSLELEMSKTDIQTARGRTSWRN